MRAPLEKSFFSTPTPSTFTIRHTSLLAIVAARSALRKGRENRSRSPPESAIQYRNLFQFHGSSFATTARRPTAVAAFHFYRSLSEGPLSPRPLIRVSSPSPPFPSRFSPRREYARAHFPIHLAKLSFYPLRISFESQRLLVAQVRLILRMSRCSATRKTSKIAAQGRTVSAQKRIRPVSLFGTLGATRTCESKAAFRAAGTAGAQ